MQDGATPHFALPVCTWIENHFLVGGLGFEDQQNSFLVIYFCGVGPRGKSNNQNQENGMEKHSGYCAAVTFCFLGKGVEFVSSRLQGYVQNVGASAEI
jgi:hypothetical protein